MAALNRNNPCHTTCAQWRQCGGAAGSCTDAGLECVDAAWAQNICKASYQCRRFSSGMWQCVP